MLIVKTLLLLALAAWACYLALSTAGREVRRSRLQRWGTVFAAVAVGGLHIYDAIGEWRGSRATNEHHRIAEATNATVERVEADVEHAVGVVSALDEHVRAGHVSRPAFDRLAEPLRGLLHSMAGVVEAASKTGGDPAAMLTEGFRTRPRITPEEKEKLLHQIQDAVSKLDVLAAGG